MGMSTRGGGRRVSHGAPPSAAQDCGGEAVAFEGRRGRRRGERARIAALGASPVPDWGPPVRDAPCQGQLGTRCSILRFPVHGRVGRSRSRPPRRSGKTERSTPVTSDVGGAAAVRLTTPGGLGELQLPRIAAAIGFRALRGSGQEAGWSTSFRDWAAQRRTTRAKSSRRPWRTRVRNPADGPVRAAAVHGRLSRVPWRKRRAADCPRADTVPMLATWTRSGYDQAARRARARILHLRSGPAG